MTVPLVLLHGSFGQGDDWSEIVDRLDRPAITPDLPGHGARFAEPAPAFGDAAIELSALIPRGADLVGYSLGGRLALQLAALDPSTPPIRSLVLESAHPGVSADEIRAEVGWELRVAEPLGVTPAPKPETLRLLREDLDPKGLYL